MHKMHKPNQKKYPRKGTHANEHHDLLYHTFTPSEAREQRGMNGTKPDGQVTADERTGKAFRKPGDERD